MYEVAGQIEIDFGKAEMEDLHRQAYPVAWARERLFCKYGKVGDSITKP